VKLDVATQSDEVLHPASNVDRSMNVTQGAGHMRNLSSLDIDYAATQSMGKFHYQSSTSIPMQRRTGKGSLSIINEHSNAKKNMHLPISPSESLLMKP